MENRNRKNTGPEVTAVTTAGLQQALLQLEEGLREKTCFEPTVALRAAQVKLSELRQREGDTPAVLDYIEQFIQRGSATGVLLDDEDERWSAQSVLDYWANLVARADRPRPEATLAEFDPAQAPELPDEQCPYLGLNAFQENDSTRFFGRGALIDKMIELLRRQRLMAVVGPSGSGKSSLVRAGLLPQLRRGVLPGSETWRILPAMVPGSDPLAALAALKIEPDEEPPRLLVVDQFEEVFTLCEDERARQQFVDALVALVSAKVAHRVILTVRSDFESYLTKYEALYKLYDAGRALITPLEAGELRAAIERPAALVGLKFEAGVEDRLLHDLLGEPAGLPLLQFSLLMLWEERQRNRITLATYKRIGGGRKALSNCADSVYEKMIPQDQATAKRLLLRLALAVDDRLEMTRSRVPRSTLYLRGEDPERVDRVLQKLVHARLLRLTPGSAGQEDQVEVAHEALVRNWPTLAQWLLEARGALSERHRLESRAKEWVRLGRGNAGLFDAVEVAEAELWLERTKITYPDHSPALDDLIAASRRALAEASRQKEEAQRRQLELEFQRQRAEDQTLAAQRAEKARRATVLVAALLAVALLGAMVAIRIAWLKTMQAQQLVTRLYDEQGRHRLDQQDSLGALVYLSKVYSETKKPGKALLMQLAQVTRMADAQLLSLEGHQDVIYRAAFSPDGTRIVTASSDNTAKIWDAQTGKELLTLAGHKNWVRSAAFSPDGTRVVTASDDNTVKVWDAQNGNELRTLTGHAGAVSSATFSADGTRIVTTSWDNTAKIWDAQIGDQPLLTLKGHENAVLSAAFSTDGTQVVTASADKTAKIWNLQTGKVRLTMASYGAIHHAAFNADGTRVITTGEENAAHIWNTQSGESVLTLEGHRNSLFEARFSADGTQVVTASADDTAKVWNAQTGRELLTLACHQGVIFSAAFSADGSRVVTAGLDKTAKVWDVQGSKALTLQGHDGTVYSAAFSTNGTRAITASADKTAKIWDAQTGRDLRTLKGHEDVVSTAMFSADGTRALTASEDKTAKIWNVQTGKELLTLRGHQGRVFQAAFSADGTQVTTACDDGTAKIWDAQTGKELLTLQGHRTAINGAAFSADRTRVITAGRDDTAKVWDARTGSELLTLTGHQNSLTKAEFSVDGTRIVTASSDKTAKIWDAHIGTEQLSLRGHQDRVRSAVFSTDGTYIVTASEDKTAKIWDAHSGEELLTIQSYQDQIHYAAFSADGTRVITAGGDETAKIWNVVPETRSPEQIAALVRCRSIFRLAEEGRLLPTTPQTRDCPSQKREDSPYETLVRIHNLRASAWMAIQGKNLKLARMYGQQALELSQKTGWKDEEADARLTLGVTARIAEDLPEAQSQLGKSKELCRSRQLAWCESQVLRELALLYHERLNDSAAALADLEQANKLAPNDPDILANRAEAQFASGKFADFFRDVSAALKVQTDPGTRTTLAAYAWAATLLANRPDRQQRARDFLSEYLRRPEGEATPWVFNGTRHALQQRPDHPADIARINKVLSLLEKPCSPAVQKELTLLVGLGS